MAANKRWVKDHSSIWSEAILTQRKFIRPQLVRIGGSHAQREVFEDTMLEAYIRAEQFKKAEDMLRQRLGQRESVRDTFWLGRVQSSKDQAAEATGSGSIPSVGQARPTLGPASGHVCQEMRDVVPIPLPTLLSILQFREA